MNGRPPCSRYELQLMSEIADRALKVAAFYGWELQKFAMLMDIENAHRYCPLHLDKLLKADEPDFAHDVFGIRKHMNRVTGELEGIFMPRYALVNHPPTTKEDTHVQQSDSDRQPDAGS